MSFSPLEELAGRLGGWCPEQEREDGQGRTDLGKVLLCINLPGSELREGSSLHGTSPLWAFLVCNCPCQ